MTEIIELIIKWFVPALCVSATAALTALWCKYKALGNGLQSLLRTEIIKLYEKYRARGYCPIYAKDALRRAYYSYHALGGNDVATGLYNEIMELPIDSSEKKDDLEDKI